MAVSLSALSAGCHLHPGRFLVPQGHIAAGSVIILTDYGTIFIYECPILCENLECLEKVMYQTRLLQPLIKDW
jgi:hypothetical protein